MTGPLAARLAPTLIAHHGHAKSADLLAQLRDVTDLYPAAGILLAGFAEHSPFLWRLAQADPQGLREILLSDPAERLAEVLAKTSEDCAAADDAAIVRRCLRQTRAHVALLIAAADLGGVWTLNDVTQALSAAADTYVRCALDFLLKDAVAAGQLSASGDAASGSGVFVLALGKLGGGELNYSSDIDLVVFYDLDRAALAPTVEPQRFYVRMTQALTRLLSERTEDGYVARVDLRLRPDPGSTPVAVSVGAAYSYYETVGQNWERAAYIKARPIAGAVDAATEFLRELEPFVWRRYFDYAAIADIHAMKRQIHVVRGFADVTVPGHDLKVGRGGIREIEFFVQTQQLIFGGRRPVMRGRRTLDMLDQLVSDGWVTTEARDELSAAYVALRTIEHRLQMVDDEQTQRLPADPERLARFAQFCGFATAEAFSGWLTEHLRAVEKHYARLFEHAPELGTNTGDLVFTGTEPDAGTAATLLSLGYRKPERVIAIIRDWHFGHHSAIRSARAREVLTELVPALLDSFAQCGDPDGAIVALDAALARMPAATELFSVLRSSGPLRTLFGDILGAAPRLTATVIATPHVLDAIIDRSSFTTRFDGVEFTEEIMRFAALDATEDFLDRCRLVARESQFVAAVRVLSRTYTPTEAGPAYAGLASALIAAALAHTERVFARNHGRIAGMEVAILGMGRLGSREMTATSDLDLMVIYRAPIDSLSDGRRQLAPGPYAARLTQRLIAALTAPTREGRLYEIDLRLRPWGTQGPLAVSFESFAQYQADEAETWERMALCRARPIAGDARLRHALEQTVTTTLAQPRDPAGLATDVLAMRSLVANAKNSSDPFDLKTRPGGLTDVDFIAQYLTLRYASACPGVAAGDTAATLRAAMSDGLIADECGRELLSAHRVYSDVVQMQRLALLVGTAVGDAPPSAQRVIAGAAGFPDLTSLRDALASHTKIVSDAFRTIVRAPRESA